MRIVQLMTGFDRITEDNEHFAETTEMVLSERSSHDYDIFFDTDHKLLTYLQNVI